MQLSARNPTVMKTSWENSDMVPKTEEVGPSENCRRAGSGQRSFQRQKATKSQGDRLTEPPKTA